MEKRGAPAGKWRAHRAVPGDSGEPPRAKGELTSQAREERGARTACATYFVCALTFAGMYSEITCFFRLRGWRTRGPAAALL